MILRSMMFVPGHVERYLKKAAVSEADALILDLEDAVPRAQLEQARRMVGAWLNPYEFAPVFPLDKWLCVRINRDSLDEDLEAACRSSRLNGIMLPKAGSQADVIRLAKKLGTIEDQLCIPHGHFRIVPLIETCAGVLCAAEIARSSVRVVAMAFGSEDFLTDLGGQDVPEALLTPKAMIAMAAHAAGVEAIDTVWVKLNDMGGLAHSLETSKALGFTGMLVVHPKQLDMVNSCYTPTAKEIGWAEDVLKRAEAAEMVGRGVDFDPKAAKFIGPPFVLRARKILARAREIEEC